MLEADPIRAARDNEKYMIERISTQNLQMKFKKQWTNEEEEREHEIFQDGPSNSLNFQVAPHLCLTMSSERELMNSHDISSPIEAARTEERSYIT